MRAAGEAIRARARRRPLCVVLDDAQFADDTALDALEYAALAEAGAPLFICALGRPSFEEARKSFGERAARQGVHRLGTEVIVLDEIDDFGNGRHWNLNLAADERS